MRLFIAIACIITVFACKNSQKESTKADSNTKTEERVELPVPLGTHQTSRYSLVKVFPQTGRMHQIRKHLAHIHHPIIGDRPHGCNKQNRLFKDQWKMDTMMLHAHKLSFAHPTTKEIVNIEAPLQAEFNRVMKMMGWKDFPKSSSLSRQGST